MEIVIFAAIAIMFALWPDVDIKSIGQKLFYTIFFVTDIVLIFYFQEYKIAAYFGLLIILPVLAKHRGWTHWRTTAILLPAPLMLAPMYMYGGTLLEGAPYYCAAVTGYFSHLFFDKKLL
jgi:formate/nitrite transporter FocA (FNT family)